MAEGRIWQVFNMQGNSRTWYAGSSVGFESVRSVISESIRALIISSASSAEMSNPPSARMFNILDVLRILTTIYRRDCLHY